MESKRFLLKTPSLGNLWLHTLSQLICQALGLMSLKVIVWIRGLNGENKRRGKPELDNVNARWTVQTQVY